MACEITFRCVICDRIKQEANHWSLARETSGGLQIVREWDQQEAMRDDVSCVCGQACLHILLDRFISS